MTRGERLRTTQYDRPHRPDNLARLPRHSPAAFPDRPTDRTRGSATPLSTTLTGTPPTAAEGDSHRSRFLLA